MTHYQTLGVEPQATAKEISSAYKRLLATIKNKDELAAIKQAYYMLSNPFRRNHYDNGLDLKQYVSTIDRRPITPKQDYHLHQNPHALNHYEFINQLFNTAQGSEEYLIPGQPISAWDRNRIYQQLKPISEALFEEKKRLEYDKTKDKKQFDLLLRNASKISLAIFVLTTRSNEKCLYDLSLGPTVVPHTKEMQEIAQLIGGWEKMAEFVKRHPELSSANALFFMRKADCLNTDTFSLFMTCENSMEFSVVSDVVRCMSLANLLTPKNFELALRNKKHALPLSRSLLSLGFAGLLNQQVFEGLISAGDQAELVGEALKYLAENNLFNQTNLKKILALSQEKKSIDILIDNGLTLLKKLKFTPEEGLALHWKGETPELQALSLSIDEMFAYGFNLLGTDDSKAQTVFMLALDLKKSLQTHFHKSPKEQLKTERAFKGKFIDLLHSQDQVMSAHCETWGALVANIVIACTGVGLFVLGIYYLSSGHCFWANTQRENLRNEIESSPWLQQTVC